MSTQHAFDNTESTSGTSKNYSLAIDEIRLERSINNLSDLVESLDKSVSPRYLLEEIAYQEQQLSSLRKNRK